MVEGSSVDKNVYVTEMRYDNGAGSGLSRSMRPDNTLGAGSYSGLGWHTKLLFNDRLGEFDNAEDDGPYEFYNPAEVAANGNKTAGLTSSITISGGFRQTATWKHDNNAPEGQKTEQLRLILEDWMTLGGGGYRGTGPTGTAGANSFIGGGYGWNSYNGAQFHRTGYALHSYKMSVFFGMTAFDGIFKMRTCVYGPEFETVPDGKTG